MEILGCFAGPQEYGPQQQEPQCRQPSPLKYDFDAELVPKKEIEAHERANCPMGLGLRSHRS